MARPFIIGVSGGTASGKSSICRSIFESLGSENCSIIRIDSFCKDSSNLVSSPKVGLNQPESIDFLKLAKVLKDLKEKLAVTIEDLGNNVKTELIPTRIILVEGNMVLFNDEVRRLFDLKIFVHTDDDERLARRVMTLACGKESEIVSVIDCYRKFDKPAFDRYVVPTIRFADIIIPKGVENKAAMGLLKENLGRKVNSN